MNQKFLFLVRKHFVVPLTLRYAKNRILHWWKENEFGDDQIDLHCTNFVEKFLKGEYLNIKLRFNFEWRGIQQSVGKSGYFQSIVLLWI